MARILPSAMRPLALVLLACLVLAAPARAVQPDEVMADPKLESRARELSAELRCMVCQNQSIDDSDAPLARDLRLIVRERLKAGDSNTQVLDFMVQRYGEFVLLRPTFSWRNALLWATPALVLALGILASLLALRHRRAMATAAEAHLSADEEAKLKQLLSYGDTPPRAG